MPQFNLVALMSKAQYWQLIDIPRVISSYCIDKDICPFLNLHPNIGVANTAPIWSIKLDLYNMIQQLSFLLPFVPGC